MHSYLTTILCVVLGYVLGSVPFSALLLRWRLGADIQRIWDGNPGAANAWKAGGWRIGVSALLLDYLKGVLPVGLANYALRIEGWGLAAVAAAPVIGHACSIFLRFRGGKALAVTFGIWTGLTLWEAPTLVGLLFILGIVIVKDHAWTVILGMVGLLIYLLLRGMGPAMLILWGINMAILTWKHWSTLGRLPRFADRVITPPRQS